MILLAQRSEEYIEQLHDSKGNDEYEFIEEDKWVSSEGYEYSNMFFIDKSGLSWIIRACNGDCGPILRNRLVERK